MKIKADLGRFILLSAILFMLGTGDAAWAKGMGGGGMGGGGMGGSGGDAVAGEKFFRYTCSGCHTFGRGPHLGPDLANRHMMDSWVRRFLTNPAEATANTGYGQMLLAEWGYVMPNFNLTSAQIDNLLAFFKKQDGLGALAHTAPVALTTAQFDEAKDTYFNRCAGCHGLYRTGATGPNIDEARSEWVGSDGLGAIMRYGTPRGMPDLGRHGLLTDTQIVRLASFLQQAPPAAPALSMEGIRSSWELVVPVSARPTAPAHSRNWENFFGVILRDVGKVAIFDGDTKEEIARLDVGFAVHILRSSSSGRYFQAIGRDGQVTMIDLWTSVPSVVARVKGCYDARSVETSKYAGFEDRYLIEGCYWPPQYVTYDGLTLEPLARVDLPMTSITGETLPEVRIASIVSSPFEPLWVTALKESGYVGLIDYSDPQFPLASTIPAERFLHDGGWDHTGRYFLVAANASNKMAVIDVSERRMVTSFTTGVKPHPGRGANWVDPVYGWVNATPHLGEAKLSVYGADPAGSPEHAWKVVRQVALPSAGSLFLKTHPQSPWVLVDMTMSTDSDKKICAYSKAAGTLDRCFDVATKGKAVHFEFNRDGSEVWVSDWATDGAIIVLDGQTLAEKTRITGIPTPTGKFNVYNTAHDVY